MENEFVSRVSAHADRLRQLRPGIADYAAREALRLGARLGASVLLPAGQWRDLSIKAVESQLQALDAELGRLQVPAIATRVTP